MNKHKNHQQNNKILNYLIVLQPYKKKQFFFINLQNIKLKKLTLHSF